MPKQILATKPIKHLHFLRQIHFFVVLCEINFVDVRHEVMHFLWYLNYKEKNISGGRRFKE